MAANRARVLGGAIEVGDYITTDKPTDVWWKVLDITTDPYRPHCPGATARVIRFAVVNKAGYRKEITDMPGTGRRLYKWIAGE